MSTLATRDLDTVRPDLRYAPERLHAEAVVEFLNRVNDNKEESDTPPTKAPDRINRLDDIATLVRTLTYGEMMELAAAIWKMKPEEELDEKTLPATLHRWSGERGD